MIEGGQKPKVVDTLHSFDPNRRSAIEKVQLPVPVPRKAVGL